VGVLSQLHAVHFGYRNASRRIDETAPKGSGGRVYLAGQSNGLRPRAVVVLRYPSHRPYHGRRHQKHALRGERSLFTQDMHKTGAGGRSGGQASEAISRNRNYNEVTITLKIGAVD